MNPLSVTIIVICREVDAMTEFCIQETKKIYPEVLLLVVPDEIPSGKTIVYPGVDFFAVKGNMSIKRNRAVERASSDYVAFLDNDAFPKKGWFESAVRILQENPEIGVVGGPNIGHPDEPQDQRVVGNATRSFLVTGPFTYRKSIGKERNCHHLSSCNMVLRRSVFLAVGGMNELYYTSEDMTLTDHLKKNGYLIRYHPEVFVYHKNRTLRGHFLQRFVWGLGAIPAFSETQRIDFVFYFASAFFIALMVLGAALVPLMRWERPYLGMLGIYLLVVLFEAVRTAGGRWGELWKTFLAILAGNLGPGLGVWCYLFSIKIDRKKLYPQNVTP